MIQRYIKKIFLKSSSYLPSPIKLGFYKLMGAKIEENVYLGLGSYIIPYFSNFRRIHIGRNTVIGDNIQIIAKDILIGNNVEIKNNTKITGESKFEIGNFSYIDQNVIINLRRDVEIGNEVGIGANSSLYTHSVWLPALDGAPVKFGKIIIRNRAWIPANVFIMPGVTVGKNAIVGACSVVTKDVPENTIVVGNPAMEIKRLSPAKLGFEEKNKIIIDMIIEFIERFNENISILEKKTSKIKFYINLDKRLIGFLPCKEKYLVIYTPEANKDILKEISKLRSKWLGGTILISLSFRDNIKETCEKKKVLWIDMENRLGRVDSSITVSLLLKSFENNGLRFNFLED